MCGSKGGKCPACGGKEAYCCTREDWKLNLNGDCPDDAVKAIFKYSTGHVCVVTRGIKITRSAIGYAPNHILHKLCTITYSPFDIIYQLKGGYGFEIQKIKKKFPDQA